MEGDTCIGGKHRKVRVTALLSTNIDDSDHRVPLVIGKSKTPRCSRSYVLEHYRHNLEDARFIRGLAERVRPQHA
ncbi:hypothetical protein HPB48_001077 [Haemaphysalis longicornis]|uniref:Uncharacterized protein n=1 Tax=Haemaphysalis longicornis TaxID=44386 RepID=A0A9J6GTK2_HAELO|nr:hypothetical protein HPB48_001077 [Haemaphysalis longicornis]